MFEELERINDRPEPFQYYTAEELWTNEHTSKMMLEFHLNESEKVGLDKYTIIEQDRIREVYNWLQYFSKESLIEELERNHFKIENIYSNVAGSEYDSHGIEMAVIAKKAM